MTLIFLVEKVYFSAVLLVGITRLIASREFMSVFLHSGFLKYSFYTDLLNLLIIYYLNCPSVYPRGLTLTWWGCCGLCF